MKEMRNIKIALALGAGLTVAVPLALNATTNSTPERRQTTVVQDKDDDGDWGWLGLLGLAGLAGLLRKDKRVEPTVTTYTDSNAKKF